MTQEQKSTIKRRPAHRASNNLSQNKSISPASLTLLILTPLCVIASILLPSVVSSYQNNRMIDVPQYYMIPVDEIAAAAEATAQSSDLKGKEAVMLALQVLSEDHYQVVSSEGFRMKRDQVIDEITKSLSNFSRNGFGVNPNKVVLDDISQELVIGADGTNMVRAWKCSYRFKDKSNSELNLIIDDASGKVVIYELDSRQTTNSIDTKETNDAGVVSGWVKMWSAYLGIEFDNAWLEDEMMRTKELLDSNNEEDSTDEKFDIELSTSLLIKDSKIFLNLFWAEEYVAEKNESRLVLNMMPQAEYLSDFNYGDMSNSITSESL